MPSSTSTLGYTYDLSKRTNLYAYASYDNYAFQRDATDTAFAVGLRHRATARPARPC